MVRAVVSFLHVRRGIHHCVSKHVGLSSQHKYLRTRGRVMAGLKSTWKPGIENNGGPIGGSDQDVISTTAVVVTLLCSNIHEL